MKEVRITAESAQMSPRSIIPISVPRNVWDIIGWHPSVSKCNRLHVDIFRHSFFDLRHILNWLFLKVAAGSRTVWIVFFWCWRRGVLYLFVTSLCSGGQGKLPRHTHRWHLWGSPIAHSFQRPRILGAQRRLCRSIRCFEESSPRIQTPVPKERARGTSELNEVWSESEAVYEYLETTGFLSVVDMIW